MVNRQYLDEAEPSAAFAWCVPLACSVREERQLSALLDPGEATRAARFAARHDRRRYAVSHGVLRLILSAFTGSDPGAIRIAIGARGKPHVVGSGPHFSLSHGGDMALIAVTTGGPTGVDVERVRPDLGLDSFARALVPAPETARIETLAPEARTRAWFQAWTRLEAIAKASGNGLSEDSVDDIGGFAAFRISNLDIDDAHVGAVATLPSVARVVYETFPDISSALARFGPA